MSIGGHNNSTGDHYLSREYRAGQLIQELFLHSEEAFDKDIERLWSRIYGNL
jgi:hypothetical protein